jgi:hypothetical protein
VDGFEVILSARDARDMVEREGANDGSVTCKSWMEGVGRAGRWKGGRLIEGAI